MFSEQVREEVDEGEEEEEEDTTMLGYWSNPEAEVNHYGYQICVKLMTCESVTHSAQCGISI